MKINYLILCCLIFIVSGCTANNKDTPTNSIKDYSEYSEKILNYSEEDNVVVFQYNKTVVIGSLTNNLGYKYNGNREVAVTITGDSDNMEEEFFYNDQYVHPDSNQRFIWGKINRDDVLTLEINYYNNDGELIYSQNDKVENNIFLVKFDSNFEKVHQRVFILKDAGGNIVKKYKH